MHKNLWLPAVIIPVIVCAIIFALILGIGEFLLSLGEEYAIGGALGLLILVLIVATAAARRVG